MAHHNLDSLDKKILRLIAEDARMPFLEVARVCNVNGRPRPAHVEEAVQGKKKYYLYLCSLNTT